MHHYIFEKSYRGLVVKERELNLLESRAQELAPLRDDWLRPYMNNARYSDDLGNYVIALRKRELAQSKENNDLALVRFYHKENILKILAENGDYLARNTWKYLQKLSHQERDVILEWTRVPEKLLLRKLTEKEYYGIAEGRLPFAQDGQKA